jgi:hypothetical protein
VLEIPPPPEGSRQQIIMMQGLSPDAGTKISSRTYAHSEKREDRLGSGA